MTRVRKVLGIIANLVPLASLLLLAGLCSAQTVSPQGAIPGSMYFAIKYNYGGIGPNGLAPAAIYVDTGNSATGAGALVVRVNAFLVTADGRQFMPFATNAPIIVDSGANQETVTPTGVSCATPALGGTCIISATFANTHGSGTRLASGTFGLQEAINDANAFAGGTVWVDQAWARAGGLTATITGITSTTPAVWVADVRGPGPITWFGKSGTGAAAYSAQNNDIVSSGAGATFTKVFSQTYTVAPVCVGSGTTGAATAVVTSTTQTAVTCTGTCTVHCGIVK